MTQLIFLARKDVPGYLKILAKFVHGMSVGRLHNYWGTCIRQCEIINNAFMRNVGVILVKGEPEESVTKLTFL